MKQHVENLLKASGVDLSNDGGFEELEQFQEYLSDYKNVVFDGLNQLDAVLFHMYLFRYYTCPIVSIHPGCHYVGDQLVCFQVLIIRRFNCINTSAVCHST